MKAVIEFLQGKKTNILLIIWLILGMLGNEGVLSLSTIETIQDTLLPLMGMSGAAKIDRMVKVLRSPGA